MLQLGNCYVEALYSTTYKRKVASAASEEGAMALRLREAESRPRERSRFVVRLRGGAKIEGAWNVTLAAVGIGKDHRAIEWRETFDLELIVRQQLMGHRQEAPISPQ